ncbi:hypothetical protein E2C01_034597 [Portunus trituberculatus]|uniref:Uncharacterized protein n=1 Tax=Portunus trituberculatus TaxID=210409 RepID=A0A5B7F655_PORTR|nr:hypothetical protein [Portunus trituberculatus]
MSHCMFISSTSSTSIAVATPNTLAAHLWLLGAFLLVLPVRLGVANPLLPVPLGVANSLLVRRGLSLSCESAVSRVIVVMRVKVLVIVVVAVTVEGYGSVTVGYGSVTYCAAVEVMVKGWASVTYSAAVVAQHQSSRV